MLLSLPFRTCKGRKYKKNGVKKVRIEGKTRLNIKK